MEEDNTITKEELYIGSFMGLLDGSPNPDACDKELLDKFREATGLRSSVTDALFKGFVAGVDKGFELAEYLYNQPANN